MLSLKDVVLPLAQFNLQLTASLAHPTTALFGPSGAGKTSLLDLIAGLRRAESASITLEGRVLTDTNLGVHLAAGRRGIGYVPQDLALFPHLNVRRNLCYGIRANGSAAPFNLDHVTTSLELDDLLERNVNQLSGGEQRRVALGRALLSSPHFLLLDEPLASLDSRLRSRLITLLQRVRDEYRVPMLYVTHEVSEVHALCGDVMVMERGRIVRRGKPQEVLAGEE